MVDVSGNLWTYDADWLCLTTNGFVRRDGRGVMGAGCAREATGRLPGIDARLGQALIERGNHVHYLGRRFRTGDEQLVFSFPVKRHWKEQADLGLIERSAHELRALWERAFMRQFAGRSVEVLLAGNGFDCIAERADRPRVVLPRPGCGNGRRSYDEVRPLLEEVLGLDAFHVITYKR